MFFFFEILSTPGWLYIYIHMYIYIDIYKCIHTHEHIEYIYIHIEYIYICGYELYVYTCLPVYTQRYGLRETCRDICAYIYRRKTNIHVYIYIYICTHICI